MSWALLFVELFTPWTICRSLTYVMQLDNIIGVDQDIAATLSAFCGALFFCLLDRWLVS
jgi:hypothetical protein